MGMEQKVSLDDKPTPTWAQVRDFLKQRGLTAQMRMIDGQLAFPDEEPPDDWKEIRVGAPPGMVTLRRADDSLVLVTWGNADVPLREFWNALTWAVAALSGGPVMTFSGPVDAATFRQRAEMPPGLG